MARPICLQPGPIPRASYMHQPFCSRLALAREAPHCPARAPPAGPPALRLVAPGGAAVRTAAAGLEALALLLRLLPAPLLRAPEALGLVWEARQRLKAQAPKGYAAKAAPSGSDPSRTPKHICPLAASTVPHLAPAQPVSRALSGW